MDALTQILDFIESLLVKPPLVIAVVIIIVLLYFLRSLAAGYYFKSVENARAQTSLTFLIMNCHKKNLDQARKMTEEIVKSGKTDELIKKE